MNTDRPKTTKTLCEIFYRYHPKEEWKTLLNEASNINVRISREHKMVEVDAFFPAILPKKTLYAIENEICAVYEINSVRIFPNYPSEFFTPAYIPEVLLEAKRIGVITRGFFKEYEVSVQEHTISILISFTNGGIDLLYQAGTNQMLSTIVKKEFGLDYTFQVRQTVNYNSEADYASYAQSQKDFLSHLGKESREVAVAEQKAQEIVLTEEEKPQFTKVWSLSEEKSEVIALSDTTYQIGYMKFDIANAGFVYGNEFLIHPIALRELNAPKRNVVALGEVFAFEAKENRKGNRMMINFAITDKDTSIGIKCILEKEAAEGIVSNIKDGKVLAIKGHMKLDNYDNELVLFPTDIALIQKIPRMDNAPEKRIELHLHTTLSSMDATMAPEVAVKTAYAWGHKAVAITDHANVQGFPEAMVTAEKLGMKVIYGLEGYFVDDTARAVYGEKDGTFEDEFVVFDIETTGLSPLNNKITEIGAVRLINGVVTEVFNTFVDPQVPIPENIIQLTGITDEMVANAPFAEEAVTKFLEFAGDSILVAHNAGFDISFIRKTAEEFKIPFSNAYIDTVALSRYINPDLKRHTLDSVAKYYNLGNFNHHRASDDAEILATILLKMFDKFRQEGVHSMREMNRVMGNKADPLQLKTYHQILLVKNQTGLKNLYKLVSMGYLSYFKRTPRIPKTVLSTMRDGLLIGSACEAGEVYSAILEDKPWNDLLKIASFYDYLEIQPLCNNQFLVNKGTVASIDKLKEINATIIKLGRAANKPVVATCDAHFLEKEDEISRKILLNGMKFSDADRDVGVYFRTTEEMMEEFSYLGEETAYEVVIKNPNWVNDQVEIVRPIPKGTYTPKIEGAEEDFQRICWAKAKAMYGEPLPNQVEERLKKELDSIIKHGFAVLYMIAQKLVENSEKSGYLVGSRGSVGSSFAATMSGITEVNPLPPHYLCPNCQYSQFIDDGSVGSGYDLPDKNCPQCGKALIHDGHDIPFETFLGFYGDKSPDIDLNFSGDVQANAHKYTEVLFGKENVFRAGTLGSLAGKTAYGFVAKYLEGKGIQVSKAEMSRLVNQCIGVKRTTGQHPGGIVVIPKEYEIYDFTPVQHPADDANSTIVTTHFDFNYLHDTILKLDILGHDVPTKYKMLERFTGIDVRSVPMNDPKVMDLFLSTKSLGVTPQEIGSEVGTFGIPEFGTKFVQQMLVDTQPKGFGDLLQISGLSHGTDVWLGNAKDLVTQKICTVSDVVGTRDSIMIYLIYHGLEKSMAFKIMEDVRKGKGLKPEYEEAMIANQIPDWYISSCKKIKYMFPKAHAAAYDIASIRLAWYKVHHPIAFYASYFSVSPEGFDAEIVMKGKGSVVKTIQEIEEKGMEASQKENDMVTAFQLVNEYYARGFRFLPIDLQKSDSHLFLPEEGRIRIPFCSLAGLGDKAAMKIVDIRNQGKILSVEDLRQKAQLSKSVIEILQKNGVLTGLSETNQISFF